uniref:Pseudouridine synthase b n=1 Tax=Encephalitozoon cuniculi TaxID=6035 RepID=M1K8S7_ENCCN|nr:pseudouridine synthase b [Encephalitozoon cuniculi]
MPRLPFGRFSGRVLSDMALGFCCQVLQQIGLPCLQMKSLFNKVEISSSCCLGKKDKRDINKQLGHEVLEKNETYMVHRCKNKASLISLGGSAILFCLNRKYFPTIRYLEGHGGGFYEVFLDEGALEPLCRGADVMIPGVLKYKDLVKKGFEAGDTIVVRIIGKSIVAVGEAIVGLKDMEASSRGVGIEVYHRVGDGLYTERQL